MGEMLDVAFNAALDRLERQESSLDNVRARVGTLVGAASLAASFLGASLIDDADGIAFGIGAGLFLGVIAIGLSLLLPRSGWIFSPKIPDLLEHYIDDDPEAAKLILTRHMAGWITENQTRLDEMHRLLAIAVGGLGFALLAWFIELAT